MHYTDPERFTSAMRDWAAEWELFSSAFDTRPFARTIFVVPNYVHGMRREFVTPHTVARLAQIATEILTPLSFEVFSALHATESRPDAPCDGLHYLRQPLDAPSAHNACWQATAGVDDPAVGPSGGIFRMLGQLMLNHICGPGDAGR